MIKKITLKVLALVLVINFQVRADEGMWLLTLLNRNYDDMKKAGFKLTPEDIYSINNSSLKDAVCQFGGGCTAEMVSPDGLLLTNHHCGFGRIQAHSTDEHNYLVDGFWAMSREEELPNEGLTVRFLVRMENVTDRILPELSDTLTDRERRKEVRQLGEDITKEAAEGTHYDAWIRSFFHGNEYYLLVYEVYKDVRLVGAPPSSVGKFGGDTDNWMWPRHTGDFSVFRVYMGPDGKPAEYSTDNVPYKPKHFFPVSIGGVENDDFAMVIGFPGRTNRYLTSFGVKQAIEISNPTVVKIRDKKLSIMDKYMSADKSVRRMYASKRAGTSNYWKYFIGQTKSLKRLKVYEKKKELEAEFQKWAETSPERKEKYGNVLKQIEDAYKNLEQYKLIRTYMNEAVFRGSGCISLASRFIKLYNTLDNTDNTDKEKLNELTTDLKDYTKDFFKNFHLPLEKDMFENLLRMYYNNVEKSHHPTIFDEVEKKYKGDLSRFTETAMYKSIFSYEKKLLAFLDNPDYKTLDKDLVFKTMYSVRGSYSKYSMINQKYNEQLDTGNRIFMDGLRKMQRDKLFYPDANSTIRLTYGNVKDYIPRDAVDFDYYTTLEGVMEKEDDSTDEFVVPKKLKELYESKDYGPYAKDGEISIAFISNNDITGGNSGSPVLNANGELIGIAFDGNWEAMSGDIIFEPELQRCISVDIRYVLFIIDKYAGAKHLIDEMKVVGAGG